MFLTDRGQAVRPVAVTAGRRVEEHWAELIGRRELESLRRSLQELLTALGRHPDPSSVPDDRKAR